MSTGKLQTTVWRIQITSITPNFKRLFEKHFWLLPTPALREETTLLFCSRPSMESEGLLQLHYPTQKRKGKKAQFKPGWDQGRMLQPNQTLSKCWNRAQSYIQMNPAGLWSAQWTLSRYQFNAAPYLQIQHSSLSGAMIILGKYTLVMTSSQGLSGSSMELNIRDSCSCFLVFHFLYPNEYILNTVTGKNGLFPQAFKQSIL